MLPRLQARRGAVAVQAAAKPHWLPGTERRAYLDAADLPGGLRRQQLPSGGGAPLLSMYGQLADRMLCSASGRWVELELLRYLRVSVLRCCAWAVM